jgi:SAM-dependent methyltransferase
MSAIRRPLAGSHPPADGRTIEQFGQQWERFTGTGGAFGSVAVLEDVCGPLLALDAIAGRRVVEIGSGNGRIVNMLLDAGAAHVTAVEPSAGIEVLRANTRERAERIDYLKLRGDELPPLAADLAFCIGVLHHLENPLPTVRRVHAALPPGARFVFWVYGREGSSAYIAFAETLRRFTRVAPDGLLSLLSHALNAALGIYVALCRVLPLPLGRYMREVMARFDSRSRYFLIFDQLNCGYAKYYTGTEARELMERGGFADVTTYHRHGMSWTVIGRKPGGADERAC